mmetsp:Transcript_46652/g.117327  ORF Transcript_46652/g.117327 Transcript_46652/m.117327 type:complete len:443 (+) Transcript_46652:121-1449(+)
MSNHDLMIKGSSQHSRGSSLALSALSTPETATRDARENSGIVNLKAEDFERPVGGSSSMTATLDVSLLLAPLEARLSAQLSACEGAVEKRCNALERRLKELELASSCVGSPNRSENTDGPVEPGVHAMQAKLDSTKQWVEDTMQRHDDVIANLTKQLNVCHDRHASLQCNISEVWRQVKVDRQDSIQKYESLSNALDMRLRGLCEKISALAEVPLPSLMKEQQFVEGDAAAENTGVVRWRSSPSLGPVARRPVGEMPVDVQEDENDIGSVDPDPALAGARLLGRVHCPMDEQEVGTKPPVQRFSSVPTSPLLQHRAAERPSRPSNGGQGATVRPTSPQQTVPRSVLQSRVGGPQHPTASQQRAPGQMSPNIGSRSVTSLNQPWAPISGGAVRQAPGPSPASVQRAPVQRMVSAQELGRTSNAPTSAFGPGGPTSMGATIRRT